MADTPQDEANAIEVDLLLEAVYRRYGFDFRDYVRSSMNRRIARIVEGEGLQTISQLQDRLLHDTACAERFLLNVTVHATSMFRDPAFYLAFRTRVVPQLRALPFIRIWHVGCATGEEVYSMAILLEEEELYVRSRIYATDMNVHVLDSAKAGVFPLAQVREYTVNYQRAGGRSSFSDYYTARYDRVVFQRSLRDNVIFSQHNLVTDGSFNEFHVILCRNVLIYFNPPLAERVHRLLYESLAPSGFLAIGSRESLRFTVHENCYAEVDAAERIYQRIP